jgi:ubiquinone/menaquinone biosynthesis C-methylase UbiE
MDKIYPNSKVEVRGFIATHYEKILNLATIGKYSSLIREAIRDMEIQADDRIIDLGAGTGYNACIMAEYLSDKGSILGLDIGEEMIYKFTEKCISYPNVVIEDKRIDEPLTYNEEFDKALISFVIHGFPHEIREEVIKNVLRILKPGGEFFILDYGEFDYLNLPIYLRIPFKMIECNYAYDYLERDFKEILINSGFRKVEAIDYFNGFVRLLKGIK